VVVNEASFGRPIFVDLIVCAACSKCGEVINAEEPHVVHSRLVESHNPDKPDVLRIHDHSGVAVFHPACEPDSLIPD
jgi:hypothetical protein